jgi:hypothetical protein
MMSQFLGGLIRSVGEQSDYYSPRRAHIRAHCPDRRAHRLSLKTAGSRLADSSASGSTLPQQTLPRR